MDKAPTEIPFDLPHPPERTEKKGYFASKDGRLH